MVYEEKTTFRSFLFRSQILIFLNLDISLYTKYNLGMILDKDPWPDQDLWLDTDLGPETNPGLNREEFCVGSYPTF
jgi:hypothetical protein